MVYGHYHSLDKVEGFEDFGEFGTSHFIADHALVFYGLRYFSKWKQPVGYFLSVGRVQHETLQCLTRCLNKLIEISLNPKVLIFDQGSNIRSFPQKLERVSAEKNPTSFTIVPKCLTSSQECPEQFHEKSL